MIADDLVVANGNFLTLQLGLLGDFPERCPDQYDALYCVAFVNWRRIDTGTRPVVALSFYKR